jgi:hypothetical protein
MRDTLRFGEVKDGTGGAKARTMPWHGRPTRQDRPARGKLGFR